MIGFITTTVLPFIGIAFAFCLGRWDGYERGRKRGNDEGNYQGFLSGQVAGRREALEEGGYLEGYRAGMADQIQSQTAERPTPGKGLPLPDFHSGR